MCIYLPFILFSQYSKWSILHLTIYIKDKQGNLYYATTCIVSGNQISIQHVRLAIHKVLD